MRSITIQQLHEDTELWVRNAIEHESVALTDNGQVVAQIVPVSVKSSSNPFLHRKLLPGFAELQSKLAGGSDATQIISEMRDE